MGTSFWSTLQAEANADDGASSSSRPDTPPIPLESQATSRSQSIGIDGKDGLGTPRKNGPGRKGKETVPFVPPLIAGLPNAWDEAHESFEVLERCVYESKKMGASREQDEMMVCDCLFDRSEFILPPM